MASTKSKGRKGGKIKKKKRTRRGRREGGDWLWASTHSLF